MIYVNRLITLCDEDQHTSYSNGELKLTLTTLESIPVLK